MLAMSFMSQVKGISNNLLLNQLCVLVNHWIIFVKSSI